MTIITTSGHEVRVHPDHAKAWERPEDRAEIERVKTMPIKDVGAMMANAILASYRHILAVREQAI